MTNNMKRHLLTLYTRTPLHVGSGTSVDVVDLPIMRERITGFPVIPSTSLKGVLRQEARDFAASDAGKVKAFTLGIADSLFGAKDDVQKDDKGNDVLHAGCVQIIEAKLLAFPVRSLAGCFAWLTCSSALMRFHRDTGLLRHADGKPLPIPQPPRDEVIGGADLVVNGQVVLEEYALGLERQLKPETDDRKLLEALASVGADQLWSEHLKQRLAIVHDENFQHFVTSCTEVVARIAIDPGTRTNAGGALFNQENVPCEALFYSVLHVLPPRKPGTSGGIDEHLANLLAQAKVIQIGGDETTGHGLCETKHQPLGDEKESK